MRPPYNRRAEARAFAAALLYLVLVLSLAALSIMSPRYLP